MLKLEDVLIPTAKGITVKKVRVPALSKELDFFDDAFPDGVFIEPRNKKPRTKLRPLLKYCKDNNISPDSLTKEELKKFTISP